MSKTIVLLTDYKGSFGSHWAASPYRSGLNVQIIKNEFINEGYDVIVSSFEEIVNNYTINNGLINSIVLYTSTEDIGYYYKDFIEDVVLGLENSGAQTIPSFKYLRATNNKVFMEILRKLEFDKCNSLKSDIYGTYEDLIKNKINLNYPIVLKRPDGAMSEGVYLAHGSKELKSYARKISNTSNLLQDIKDYLRKFIHKGYTLESRFRKKFITQKFVRNLQNDWKVLIFGDTYYIFSRPVKKNDFRASGSGFVNYQFGSYCEYPSEIFNFAKSVFTQMTTPHLSIDIAFDGKKFYVIEFQALFFGTIGVIKSDVFYKKIKNNWEPIKNDITIEQVYAESILYFLND